MNSFVWNIHAIVFFIKFADCPKQGRTKLLSLRNKENRKYRKNKQPKNHESLICYLLHDGNVGHEPRFPVYDSRVLDRQGTV